MASNSALLVVQYRIKLCNWIFTCNSCEDVWHLCRPFPVSNSKWWKASIYRTHKQTDTTACI